LSNPAESFEDHGMGGQTPLFHAAMQFSTTGLRVSRLLAHDPRAHGQIRANSALRDIDLWTG
jgi:hypothetical protein